MSRFSPFQALTYDPDVAGPVELLSAPPYDVISEVTRHGYVERSPYSIVRIDRPQRGGDAYVEAGETLAGWRTAGVLSRRRPSYFAYEMNYPLGGEVHALRGIIVSMELSEWGALVLPHEDVMAGPVRDRLLLLQATRTHLSPVYATFGGPVPVLDELLERTASHPPLMLVEDREGVTHRVWEVSPDAPLDGWLGREPVMIADGHHRYTTALRFREERRREHGPGPWDRILVFLVDAGSHRIPVLPYHRVSPTALQIDDGVQQPDLATAMDGLDDPAMRYATIQASPSGPVYRTHALDGSPPTVRELHRAILDRHMNLDLSFTHDAEDADAAVRSGRAATAFLLPETSAATIQEVVEAGERLPQKSTFYWPKPRTGMVLMPLEDSVG